jgi:DNA helicase MCM8
LSRLSFLGIGRTKEKNKTLFLIYIDANSVDNNKQVNNNSSGNEHSNNKVDLMQFSAKDMFAIQEISDEKNVFKLIVNSICPGIYGHEFVKGMYMYTHIHLQKKSSAVVS